MAADGPRSFRPDKNGPGTFRSPVSVLGFLEASADASAASASAPDPKLEHSFSTAFGSSSRPNSASDIDSLLSELRLTTEPGLPIPPHISPLGPPPVLVHHDSLQSFGHHCSSSPGAGTPLAGSSAPRSQRQLRNCKSLPAPYHSFEVREVITVATRGHLK